jgi:molybdopterin-guanine dinucleotide biosynthesis protein A
MWEILTGAVLAGGYSRRFGGNKALYQIEGRSMLSRAVSLLMPICPEVLISSSVENVPAYEELASAMPSRVRIVTDRVSHYGPLGGLDALLGTCVTPWLLILTCDMPRVTEATLNEMAHEATILMGEMTDGRPRCRAVCHEMPNGDVMPFPLLVHQSVRREVAELISQNRPKVKALLQTVGTLMLPVSDEAEFTNVNRQEDIK